MSWLGTDRLVLLTWLAVVWILLWGSVSVLVLVSAVVLAPLCVAVCKLPAVPRRWRIQLSQLPAILLRFVWDLFTSSWQVTVATFRRGRRARSAIVRVDVPCLSDIALAVVANRLSLEPGTLVVEVDREADLLYVYVFDVTGRDDVETSRRAAGRSADDVLRALGARRQR